MQILKKCVGGVVLVSLIAFVAAVTSQPARGAQGAAPVVVTNTPLPVTLQGTSSINGTVQAQESGTWTVGLTGPINIGNSASSPVPVIGSVGIAGTPSVQQALPATPFFDTFNLLPGDSAKAIGVATGTLGVTTLTITNFDDVQQQLFLFNPVIGGGSCAGTVDGGSTPNLDSILLEPHRTVQLQYPTPLVFFRIGGKSCIAAEVTTTHTNAVVVAANGYVQ